MVIKEGTRYIDLKVKALDKYDSRLKHQQERLLNKLKRKEKHFANKLKNADSVAYAAYQKDATISFDSISKLSKDDTGANAVKIGKKKNSAVDSLKGISSFIQSKSGFLANGDETPDATNINLNQLQGKLNYKTYINDLITKRTGDLKNLANTNSNISGFTGIEKQVFYAKAKMKVFKEIEDDPSVAEDNAMEYLQGTDGFNKSMNSGDGTGMQSFASGTTDGDLQKLGYQTKSQTQQNLQQKFGSSLTGVTQQISTQVANFQSSTNKITGNIKDTKQSIQQLKNINRPSFKINPMRGLPFWKRIERQYNWQTTKASGDGAQPAMVNMSVLAGFKQSPKLTFGLGIASSFGLGQGWQSIHFSFQGIGYRTFATWEWQYGIGAYAGYERMYKSAAFIKQDELLTNELSSIHNTGNYIESILVGLTKKYNINNKYSGVIQVLYDIWWRQKGQPSPFILRVSTIKK